MYPKDYKKKSTTRDTFERGVKRHYFVFGFMSGVILSSGVVFTNIGERVATSIPVQFKNMTVSDFRVVKWATDIFGDDSLRPIEFDFYDQKLITHGESSSVEGAITFQTGSFRLKEDAERVRAILSASNINSRIEEVSLEGVGLLHRVLVGPLVGDASVIDTRIKILDAGIVPLTLKVDSSP
jgi:hypothetical protein